MYNTIQKCATQMTGRQATFVCGGALNSGSLLPERKTNRERLCFLPAWFFFLDDWRCFGSVLKKLMQKTCMNFSIFEIARLHGNTKCKVGN